MKSKICKTALSAQGGTENKNSLNQSAHEACHLSRLLIRDRDLPPLNPKMEIPG
jgi:hypothetical protein